MMLRMNPTKVLIQIYANKNISLGNFSLCIIDFNNLISIVSLFDLNHNLRFSIDLFLELFFY